MSSILYITGILTIFVFLIFAVSLLKSSKEKFRSNQIFAAFLASNIFLIFFSTIFRNKLIIPSESSFLYYFILSFFFTLAPLLYLYFKASINETTKFPRSYFLHFLLQIGCFIALLTDFYFRKSNLEVGSTLHVWTNLSYHIFLICLNIQILFYMLITIRLVRNYYNSAKSSYSDLSKIKIFWYFLVLSVFIIHWIFDILTSYSAVWFSSFSTLLELLSISVLFIFASIIVYRALKSEPFFMITAPYEKYQNSAITEEQKKQYSAQLKEFMQINKPYLSPTLTLNELSGLIDIHPKSLSQILNESFNQNFFDFINSYRVEEAKEKLGIIDKKNGKKTILEVLYEVGFNSKSAFNRAFKKQNGITPSQFRKGEIV